jgi:hypothetical protein
MSVMIGGGGPRKLSAITWQKVAIILGMFCFSAFALWVTASHFDATEWKSLGLLSAGAAGREFIPLIRFLLSDSTEAFSRGGQVE